jgi:hypothetical protein
MNRQYVYDGTVKKQDNKDEENKIYYKVLKPNWKCLGFKYEVGQTYFMPEETLVLCKCGFHCCEHPIECLSFYDFHPSNHYVEVKMLGKTATSKPSQKPKCATNIMKIEREIPYEEWLEFCTVSKLVTFENGSRQETTWVKGKCSKKIHFFPNGEKKYMEVFNEDGLFKNAFSYFCGGILRSITTPSVVWYKRNFIYYHRNGNIKLSAEWVPGEGDSASQYIKKRYDEEGTLEN